MVAVIARFITILAFVDIVATHTIAATGCRAGVATGIKVVVVAVIAAFDASANMAIATNRIATSRCTRIGGDVVAIIAFFAILDHTVTTSRRAAAVAAAIGIDLIPVVALLKAFGIFSQIIAQHTIAAARRVAVVATGVVVGLVGIIALLDPLLQMTIAATRGAAVV